MPINKKHIIAERRHRIAAMYLQGRPQYQIAEAVGCTQQQVSADLKVMSTNWKESALVDMNEAKSKELAKIDNLEQEYWTAWEKSKADFTQKTIKASGGTDGKEGEKPKPKRMEKTEKEMVSYGEPRYLDGVMKCIAKRCEILGIDAPKQTTMKIVDELSAKSDEELERIANGL
jgi:hypothetical protein